MNLILEGKTFDDLKQKLSEEIVKKYSWSDLSLKEKNNLEEAIDIVNNSEVIEARLEDVDIVDFQSEDFLGMFLGGRIVLTKKILSSRHRLLRTMVHEYAHYYGGDGDKAHVSKIEEIWSAIFENTRS